jgi:hypothetical protein
MSAETALLDAYREWRRLAEAEKEAISASNWSLLSAYQKALENIYGRISELSQAAREEWAKSGCDCAAKEKTLEATVRELLVLGRCNQTLLNVICEAAQAKLKQLNEAGRNLQRLKHSYGFTQPTAWSSFS